MSPLDDHGCGTGHGGIERRAPRPQPPDQGLAVSAVAAAAAYRFPRRRWRWVKQNRRGVARGRFEAMRPVFGEGKPVTQGTPAEKTVERRAVVLERAGAPTKDAPLSLARESGEPGHAPPVTTVECGMRGVSAFIEGGTLGGRWDAALVKWMVGRTLNQSFAFEGKLQDVRGQ